MATDTEKKNVTGLDQATDRSEAEYDLLQALFDAANFKEDEDNITEIEITRKGKVLFSLHLHPIGDDDVAFARKKASTFKDNPQGKKYGKIKTDFSDSKFKSWMIYLATTVEDQQKIWGNRAFMQRFGLFEPWESIDKMMTVGDKSKLLDKVFDISGLDDDDEDEMDEVTFQS